MIIQLTSRFSICFGALYLLIFEKEIGNSLNRAVFEQFEKGYFSYLRAIWFRIRGS